VLILIDDFRNQGFFPFLGVASSNVNDRCCATGIPGNHHTIFRDSQRLWRMDVEVFIAPLHVVMAVTEVDEAGTDEFRLAFSWRASKVSDQAPRTFGVLPVVVPIGSQEKVLVAAYVGVGEGTGKPLSSILSVTSILPRITLVALRPFDFLQGDQGIPGCVTEILPFDVGGGLADDY